MDIRLGTITIFIGVVVTTTVLVRLFDLYIFTITKEKRSPSAILETSLRSLSVTSMFFLVALSGAGVHFSKEAWYSMSAVAVAQLLGANRVESTIREYIKARYGGDDK